MNPAVDNERRDGESGATAIEYALLASLIAMLIIAAVTSVGQSLVVFFEGVAAAFVK